MKHIVVPNLPIEIFLRQVRIDVARATFGRQIPWESSSLMGDFYFNSEQSIPKTEKPDKPDPPSKSVSGTKVAAISDDNKGNIEPWTGIWDLKSIWGGGDKFVLKQNGNSVKSANDSLYKFSGTMDK